MGVFGDTLKQARVSKGVTLREAEQATRINRHHLSALEDEDFAVLRPSFINVALFAITPRISISTPANRFPCSKRPEVATRRRTLSLPSGRSICHGTGRRISRSSPLWS